MIFHVQANRVIALTPHGRKNDAMISWGDYLVTLYSPSNRLSHNNNWKPSNLLHFAPLMRQREQGRQPQ